MIYSLYGKTEKSNQVYIIVVCISDIHLPHLGYYIIVQTNSYNILSKNNNRYNFKYSSKSGKFVPDKMPNIQCVYLTLLLYIILYTI